MTSKWRRCDVVTSHRRRYNVVCLLGIWPILAPHPQYSKPCPPPPPNILNLPTPMQSQICGKSQHTSSHHQRPHQRQSCEQLFYICTTKASTLTISNCTKNVKHLLLLILYFYVRDSFNTTNNMLVKQQSNKQHKEQNK